MAHKPRKTSVLAFPSNWTSKWLYRAITNTPKWQVNAILNSPKWNQWISIETAFLNGTRLPEKTDDLYVNVERSFIVGLKVHEASQQYESMPHKMTYEQQVRELRNLLAHPIVGDMIKNLTEATIPTTTEAPVMTTEVSYPFSFKVAEKKGEKEIPVLSITPK